MQKKENNFAFIDSQNVNLAVRAQGWKLDWARFRIFLREKYAVTKAFLFIGFIDGNNDLYIQLQDAGFLCVYKPTLIAKDGTVKGNVDAELVLHTMIQYNNFDKAVIATGDGDFYCLVKHLLEQGKLERVLVPNQDRYSVLLKRFAKKNIDFMNNMQERLEYKKRK